MELRYEYKYLVPINKIPELRRLLIPFVDYDKYALERENNEYTVRSIYFDTPNFKYYHDKVEGISFRKKVRLRGYNKQNCSNIVFLETKSKFQKPLHKTREMTCFEETQNFFQNGDLLEIVKNCSSDFAKSNSFIYQMKVNNLRPVILVIYEREPFTEKFDTTNRLRVTFDKNLRSSAFPKIEELYEEKDIKNSLSGYFILEVKFNQFFPVWLKSIIATFQLKQQSLSKYVISLDTHQIVGNFSRYQVFQQKFI